MPLSKKGKKIKASMIKSYGQEKGKKVFYASEHSHPSWVKHQIPGPTFKMASSYNKWGNQYKKQFKDSRENFPS
jgi:hypothetical protein